jgi:hypothetical protein
MHMVYPDILQEQRKLSLKNLTSSKDGCLQGCSAVKSGLVNFYQTTRCYNPEDSHLRTHRRENLKSYLTSSSIWKQCGT